MPLCQGLGFFAATKNEDTKICLFYFKIKYYLAYVNISVSFKNLLEPNYENKKTCFLQNIQSSVKSAKTSPNAG